MSWEIHITRAEHWADSERQPISADEWLALVKSDPELTLDPRDNGPYFALWLSHRAQDDHPWFEWSEGSIGTNHPDRQTIRKTLEIARCLKARVQGDDCEFYEHP